MAWDFMCVNRLAKSHQRLATSEGPAIASEDENQKR